MYCINCGVKLEDTEKKCPLCGTEPYHPELTRKAAENLYPADRCPSEHMNIKGKMIIVLTAFLIPMIVSVLCDLQFSGGIVWSGYVAGALVLTYLIAVLPQWFKKPNPVIFVPCDFAAVILYLLYINLQSGGHWFLSFAFPVAGVFGLIVTAVVTLLRYLKRGRLYIFGGALILLGFLSVLVEFLLNLTFPELRFIAWSAYPLVSLVLLGCMLIFLAIYKPARETMERKFFF